MLTLEHIDPRNSKHICGLCNEFNEVLADASYNFRKNNRFVPYRICEHSAPETFGDVGEFLINGEWVVCEFGGEIWWKESNRIGCAPIEGAKNGWGKHAQKPESAIARGKASWKAQKHTSQIIRTGQASRRANSHPVLVTRIVDGHVFWHESVKEAARYHAINATRLFRHLNHNKPLEGFTATRLE